MTIQTTKPIVQRQANTYICHAASSLAETTGQRLVGVPATQSSQCAFEVEQCCADLCYQLCYGLCPLTISSSRVADTWLLLDVIFLKKSNTNLINIKIENDR